MKTRIVLFVLLASSLLLAACAPGPNDQVHTLTSAGLEAGIWRGIWHGLIAPITFVVSLFSPGVGVYEIHNNGNWYNLGFILGILCHHGGHAAGRRARRARVVVVQD